MTNIELKAEEIANELFNYFYTITNDSMDVLKIKSNKTAKECALVTVDSIINSLNSVKGMGKIHKVKLYKLVKEKLEAK